MFKGKLPTMFYLWHTIIHLCHIILSFPRALIEKRGFLTYSEFFPAHLYWRGSRTRWKTRKEAPPSRGCTHTVSCRLRFVYWHFQTARHLRVWRPWEGAEPTDLPGTLPPLASLPLLTRPPRSPCMDLTPPLFPTPAAPFELPGLLPPPSAQLPPHGAWRG